MCGIVGYVGKRPCLDLLVAGLEKLEYRGYDSAGISVIEDGSVRSVRAVGNLENLRAAVAEQAGDGGGLASAAPVARTGVAHTRWATHGRVTEENAHPHGDCDDRIHIVLNGIVENHAELRRELGAEGHRFSSETDAEIVSHLIERNYDGDLREAVRASFAELRGHYAFVAMHAEEPGRLVGARKECPLVAGVGEGETFLRLGDPGLPRRDPRGGGDRERRDRHDRRRGRGEHRRRRRQPGRARPRRDLLGRGGGREGRLRDLHAEGDPRTGRRRGRDDRRPPARRAGRRPLRTRALRRVLRGIQPHRDRRLRHLLPRRVGRSLRDRGVGAGAGRDGRRLRVPLPQPGDRRARPGDRHHPVGRDRGHAGGDAPRPRERRQGARGDERDGQPGDPRLRHGALHPRRSRGQRRRDQDLRRPGGGDVPAGAAAGRAARDAVRASGSPSWSPR